MSSEVFKREIKQDDAKKKEVKKINVVRTMQNENMEIKKLTVDDLDNVVKMFSMSSYDATEDELKQILLDDLSFGAYVARVLVGVGLGWKSCFDESRSILIDGELNAIYLEDVILSLAFEGVGIRSSLLKAREDEAKDKSLHFSVAYISEDLPPGDFYDYIKERGSKLTKMYLLRNYNFFESGSDVLAVKSLVE